VILRLVVLKCLPIPIIIERVNSILSTLNNPPIIPSVFVKNVYIMVLLIDGIKTCPAKMTRLPWNVRKPL
jgi:hypothetical protein